MARGLFAILEDELSSEIVPENAEQQERVEELEAQVAQGEVVQSEGEVTEMADAIDDAVTAVEELSEVNDILENSIEENEGLTEDAAAVAEVAVESICNRLGYKPTKRIVPAMESFGATSSRLDATKYALESIKGTAIRVWEAIKKFFSDLWTKIKSLWNQLIDVAERYKVRAEKLQERIKEVKKSKAKVEDNEKISVDKYCTAFNVTTPTSLASGIVTQLNYDKECVDKIAKFNDTLASTVVAVGKDGSGTVDNFTLPEFAKIAKPMSFGYVLTENKDGEYEIKQTPVQVKNAEAAVVGLDDLDKIAAAAKETCTAVQNARKNQSKAEKVFEAIIKIANEKAEGKSEKTVDGKAAAWFRKSGAMFNQYNSKVPTLGIRGAGSALDYISANLNKYKAK